MPAPSSAMMRLLPLRYSEKDLRSAAGMLAMVGYLYALVSVYNCQEEAEPLRSG